MFTITVVKKALYIPARYTVKIAEYDSFLLPMLEINYDMTNNSQARICTGATLYCVFRHWSYSKSTELFYIYIMKLSETC